MPRDGLEAFEDIAQEYFPGSTRPIVRHQNRPEEKTHKTHIDGDWDDKPRIYVVNGEKREFFTVGHLAVALQRRPVTIRKWEKEGWVPKPTFRVPSADPRGARRLYTREQVEGMIRIAAEEGILLTHQKPIQTTNFTARVIALFKETATL